MCFKKVAICICCAKQLLDRSCYYYCLDHQYTLDVGLRQKCFKINIVLRRDLCLKCCRHFKKNDTCLYASLLVAHFKQLTLSPEFRLPIEGLGRTKKRVERYDAELLKWSEKVNTKIGSKRR